MPCDRAIISRSDGATQAQIGRVFFRLQIRLALVDSNLAFVRPLMTLLVEPREGRILEVSRQKERGAHGSVYDGFLDCPH
jgi:hypothetical protein